MILIVGLGNPGKKYIMTRHNLGFRVLDLFKRKNNFSGFKFSKKFKSELSKGLFLGEKIILAKPQTFMNNSGKTVKNLVSSFKLQVSRIWVAHDDIDLPLGKMKIAIGRGSAGHKGVQSIIDELKTKNFIRFRLGTKPKLSSPNPKIIDKFVLKKFTKEEEKIIKETIKKTCQAIEFAIKEGLEKTMTKFN